MSGLILHTVISSLALCAVGWYLGKHYERGKQSDLRQEWANSIEYKQLNLDEKRGSLQMWGWIKERS